MWKNGKEEEDDLKTKSIIWGFLIQMFSLLSISKFVIKHEKIINKQKYLRDKTDKKFKLKH